MRNLRVVYCLANLSQNAIFSDGIIISSGGVCVYVIYRVVLRLYITPWALWSQSEAHSPEIESFCVLKKCRMSLRAYV